MPSILGSCALLVALVSFVLATTRNPYNETCLGSLLSEVDYLSLHMTRGDADDAEVDMAHSFVRFLLRQSLCPLQLTVSSSGDTDGTTIFRPQQRHRALVVRGRAFEGALLQYATRSGVLICVLLNQPEEDDIVDAAQRLWTASGIYQVYYVLAARIVFFNPFGMRSRQRAADAIGELAFGTLVDINQWRMADIFHNLNGYPVRTYIFDSVYSNVLGDEASRRITSATGADGNVATLLSQKLNFTLVLQWPDDEFFGSRFENGSYNGAIGRMIRYETDITLTGFFVKDYLTREVEFSVSVYMDKLCCYVSKAKRIPQSILPVFAVDAYIWLSFLLVGLVGPLPWMAIRRINVQFHVHTLSPRRRRWLVTNFQYMRIFIDTWVVWVRVNISHFPPFYSERVFVVSLCLVSVIFGAIFESSLATVYIHPMYYKDINTMHELDAANFRIYIKHAFMKDDLFYGHSSTVYKNLNRKVLLVAETEDRLIHIMSRRGGFAAVTRASSLVLNDIHYFITKKIHRIPECPKNYHIAFVFPAKSPYEKSFNVMLLKFVEAGLIAKWINEMKHKAKVSIHQLSDYVAELGDHWRVLTLKHLQLAFYALVLGCILAALSLLGELLLTANRQHTRNAHNLPNASLKMRPNRSPTSARPFL